LDCKNQAVATEYWNKLFLSFENNWDHSFTVARDPTMPQNFAFVHQNVLFLAVDVPNVGQNSPNDWDGFLQTVMAWASLVIRDYDQEMNGAVGRIVLFSHAMPKSENDAFYDALQDLFNNELNSFHPVLFINGDGHYWELEDYFRGESNFRRLQVRGEAAEDPTMIRVVATGEHQDVAEAFEYYRGYGSFGPVVAFSAIGTFVLCLTAKLLHKNSRKTAIATQ
jgi:hypothetical protein